jgi:hypothetical protein
MTIDPDRLILKVARAVRSSSGSNFVTITTPTTVDTDDLALHCLYQRTNSVQFVLRGPHPAVHPLRATKFIGP